MEAFHSYRNGMSSPFLQECKGAIPFLILYLQYAKANSSEDNVKHVIKAACSHLQKSDVFGDGLQVGPSPNNVLVAPCALWVPAPCGSLYSMIRLGQSTLGQVKCPLGAFPWSYYGCIPQCQDKLGRPLKQGAWGHHPTKDLSQTCQATACRALCTVWLPAPCTVQ